MSLPPLWRRFMHPVLVASALTLLGVYLLALMHRSTLDEALHQYTTGTRYLQLLSGSKHLALPGAGDLLASVLDVSIVALALPMFQYRLELRRHFVAICVPSVLLSVGSLFGYPAFCAAVGIAEGRSIAFAARSLTLALAGPAVGNLGGDGGFVGLLCILSGIMGVLLGPGLLRWLRIPEDDYVTRGVTLGSNSSAIATALLLVSDPRAAALSSLSMGLFGTATVALTSVPVVVRVVQDLAGMEKG